MNGYLNSFGVFERQFGELDAVASGSFALELLRKKRNVAKVHDGKCGGAERHVLEL
ncbi:MAG TPA: hypothetical protein VFI43_10300 [Nitrosospira sp.]|nr:hypothetical protein [Nitrosospira sp.]